MRYDFKAAEELFWFIVVAVAMVLFQAMYEFDPEKITDWRAWAVGVVAAAIRAVGGAGLSWLSKRRAAGEAAGE